MKKLFALLLIFALTSMCMFSCDLFGGKKDDTDTGNNGEVTETPEEDPVIEEDDGDVEHKDNIDPDGWTKVDK